MEIARIKTLIVHGTQAFLILCAIRLRRPGRIPFAHMRAGPLLKFDPSI